MPAPQRSEEQANVSKGAVPASRAKSATELGEFLKVRWVMAGVRPLAPRVAWNFHLFEENTPSAKNSVQAYAGAETKGAAAFRDESLRADSKEDRMFAKSSPTFPQPHRHRQVRCTTQASEWS